MKKNLILCMIALMTMSFFVGAQEVSPVDFMKFNPYQVNSNVALREPYFGYIGVGIGNLSVSQRNSGVYYDNLFRFDNQGRPSVIDLNQFAASLKPVNSISTNSNVEIFGFGRQLKHGYLNVGYRVKMQSEGSFTDDLFRLLASGNSSFMGENHAANVEMNFNLLAYQELAVGYQIDINKHLSLGARAKFLMGAANLNTDAFKVKLATDEDTYAIRLYEDVAMRVNSPMPFTIGEDGFQFNNARFDFTNLFGNLGLGFDLAADYRIDDCFSVVAAVNDLGLIHWKKNGVEVKGNLGNAGQFYDDGSFFFDGLSVNELQQIISDPSYREHFMDTLKSYFKLASNPIDGYSTMLHANMLLRGCYTLNENNRFFVQAQGYCSGVGFRPAMTLAYNGSFFDVLDVCASYTMMRDSYTNFGLGLGLKLGIVQLYATTNNVIGVFNPMNTKNFNAQMGLVFNIPYNFKDSGTAMHSRDN